LGFVYSLAAVWVLTLNLAPDTQAALKHAESLYSDAQYAESIAALDELLAHRELAPGQRLEALLYLGMGHLALGHEEAARARFHELLQEDPAYALPRYTSPKITQLFERVRIEVKDSPHMVALAPEMHPAAAGPDHVTLRFRVERRGDSVALVHWRRRGAATFNEEKLHGEGTMTADLPLGWSQQVPTEDFDLEYYGELEAEGKRVTGSGTAEQPLVVRVHVRATAAGQVHPGMVPDEGHNTSSDGSAPIYRRWWFWTVVGVAVVGGGVAAYAATRPTTGDLFVHFQVSP
jgi:hypothetical protein